MVWSGTAWQQPTPPSLLVSSYVLHFRHFVNWPWAFFTLFTIFWLFIWALIGEASLELFPNMLCLVTTTSSLFEAENRRQMPGSGKLGNPLFGCLRLFCNHVSVVRSGKACLQFRFEETGRLTRDAKSNFESTDKNFALIFLQQRCVNYVII